MNYNKDLIDLISELKPITTMFGIINEEDKIKIKCKTDEIGFILTAPAEYLPFPGGFLGFLDFDRFMKYFNIFDQPNKDEKLADIPTLEWVLNDEQKVKDIVIGSSRGRQKFTYRTGTEKSIKEQKFNTVKLPTIDATLILTEAQNANLHKIISIVKPDLINFAFVDDICKVTLNNMEFSDSYEIEYKLDNTVETEFNFNVLKDSIDCIPAGDYKIEVCNRGYLGFHQIRTDNIHLELYVSQKKVR